MPKQDSALRSLSIQPSTPSTLAYKGKEKRTNTDTGPNKTQRQRIYRSNNIGSAGLNTPNVWFSHKSKDLGGYNVCQPRKWFRLPSPHERLVSCRDIAGKISNGENMAQSGRTVLYYHADNEMFAENGFVEAINSKYQNITFYGVGAHHQNGTVQRKNFLWTECASCSYTV